MEYKTIHFLALLIFFSSIVANEEFTEENRTCMMSNLLGPKENFIDDYQVSERYLIVYFDSYKSREEHLETIINQLPIEFKTDFNIERNQRKSKQNQQKEIGQSDDGVEPKLKLFGLELSRKETYFSTVTDFVVLELSFIHTDEREEAKPTEADPKVKDKMRQKLLKQSLKYYSQLFQGIYGVRRVQENKQIKSTLYTADQEQEKVYNINLRDSLEDEEMIDVQRNPTSQIQQKGQKFERQLNKELLSEMAQQGQNGYKLSDIFDLEKYHGQGIKGQGIKIAIFDSGLADYIKQEESILKVEELINFTHDKDTSDKLGHGTFISGVVGSRLNEHQCGGTGIAPESELYVLKLFTSESLSYTSWFLDAFNYVLQHQIDIINLSNGGSDFLDIPFIEKINELTANGVVIVSAIGNEGPYQGTLNNPGDLINVIGVGSLDQQLSNVASFSSRGMTTWSLLEGVGNLKPDIITAGSLIMGFGIQQEENTRGSGVCTQNSGTSVSAGIITASIALTLSSIKDQSQRKYMQNSAFIKQGLVKSARRLKGLSITEQGAGVFDLDGFFNQIVDQNSDQENIIADQSVMSRIYPSKFDLRSTNKAENNTYFLPFNRQKMYASMMDYMFNVTVINQGALHSSILSTVQEYTILSNQEVDQDILQECIKLTFEYPNMIYPYFANIKGVLHFEDTEVCRLLEVEGVEIRTDFLIRNIDDRSQIYQNQPGFNDSFKINEMQGGINRFLDQATFKILIDFIKTPPRNKRVLFDQFHSLKYPENGYILRDSLLNSEYPYEWNGDHIFTNFVQLHQKLVESGFFVEVLTSCFSCFNSSNYKVLMVVDPEDYFSIEEIKKVQEDVEVRGLSLVIVGDWYNEALMKKSQFFNNNTFEVWTPFMAGANVPSINALLDKYNIALGEKVVSGQFYLDKRNIVIDSGSEIIQFPKNGYLISAKMTEESFQVLQQGLQFDESFIETVDVSIDRNERVSPVLGILPNLPAPYDKSSGSIIVFGDSSCMDCASSGMLKCFTLLEKLVRIASVDENYVLPNTKQPTEYEAKNKILGAEEVELEMTREQIYQQLNLGEILNEKFKLPFDFQNNERVKKVVLEDLDMEEIENKLQYQSYFHSNNQQCRNNYYQEVSGNYIPFEHIFSENMLYEWKVMPESLDFDSNSNKNFLVKFFGYTFGNIFEFFSQIISSQALFPFLISMTLLAVLVTLFFKNFCEKREYRAKGQTGRKFWILRRENPNMDKFNNFHSMVSSSPENSSYEASQYSSNSSLSSEDEFMQSFESRESVLTL